MGSVYKFKGKGSPVTEKPIKMEDFEGHSEELKVAMAKLLSYIYTLHLNEVQVDDLNELVARYAMAVDQDGFTEGFNNATSLWIEATMLLIERYGVKTERLSIELMDECLTEVMERRKEDAE